MLLDGDNRLRNIFVSGEISNLNNNYRSGHFYFSLKDEKSVIKAVMFSSNASRVRFKPTDGMKVIVCGRISLYEASGQYQLYVESMQPDGIGALAIAYEQLKSKLNAEGLFDSEHKLDIPQFPKKIGVITSPTGAVIQDIRNVISRRCPITEVILCPVAVQGEFAPSQLVKAVKLFNQLDNVDVIIIGRGGGSFEDLNCFNDEALIRTIYNSNIPIISAVGHETDYTLCDFVSDLRAPTPSAAAELAVPDINEILRSVDNTFLTIKNIVSNRLFFEMQAIDQLNDSVNSFHADTYIINERMFLESLTKYMNSVIDNKLRLNRTEAAALADKINNLSPINLLNKGYSIVTKDNVNIRSVTQISAGDKIAVKMFDGTAECIVQDIYNMEIDFV